MTLPVEVATFYRFVSLGQVAYWRDTLHAQAEAEALKGTILLAEEGINGTMAGPSVPLRRFVAALLAHAPFAGMTVKYSAADAANPVFHRLKVRIKPEIVALGVPGIRPSEGTGEHVDPERWNQLLADPDVPVVDVRNRYETGIGTFEGAIDPDTQSFREFPQYVADHLDPATHPRVAMFCTGGIRCEKASAYLLQQGFEAVYQLDGGILAYLEQVDPKDSRWHGECFVFDQRVSVDAQLKEGAYVQCYACRRALTPEEVDSPLYEEGRSCPHCYHELSERQQESFAERQRQVQLAAARGEAHIGARFPSTPRSEAD